MHKTCAFIVNAFLFFLFSFFIIPLFHPQTYVDQQRRWNGIKIRMEKCDVITKRQFRTSKRFLLILANCLLIQVCFFMVFIVHLTPRCICTCSSSVEYLCRDILRWAKRRMNVWGLSHYRLTIALQFWRPTWECHVSYTIIINA